MNFCFMIISFLDLSILSREIWRNKYHLHTKQTIILIQFIGFQVIQSKCNPSG